MDYLNRYNISLIRKYSKKEKKKVVYKKVGDSNSINVTPFENMVSFDYVPKEKTRVNKKRKVEDKSELKREETKDIKKLFNDYGFDYENVCRIYADGIKSLNFDETKEFLEYLNDNSILKDVTFTHSITLIEDSIIQGIIYSYVLKAKNNSINFNIDIQENINIVSEISSLDMSRILGILLDNAFEEAVKTESKNVILSIIPLKTQIIYVIKNSCNTVPDISKIFLNNYSTKGENHGRGLSIVQNICNNYSNVFFNVKIQDNFFLSELIINTVD